LNVSSTIGGRRTISRAVTAMVAVALCAGALLAQSPPKTSPVVAGDPAALGALKIGFVDLDMIFDQSRAIKAAIAVADADMDSRAKRLREVQRDFKAMQTRLDTQGSVMSDTERRRMQDEMGRMLDEVDELQFRLERDMRDRQRRTIDPVLKSVLVVVGDVGRREGFDMVLRGDVVLYGRNTTDLTGRVFEELDRRGDELLAAASASGDAEGNDSETTTTLAPRTKQLVPLIP